MNAERINNLLGIKESFEMPEALITILMSENKNKFLSEIAKYYDFTRDDFRDYFQTEHGDRDNYKQDYTPDCLCRLMRGLAEEAEEITDVCSGTGALSLAVMAEKTKHINCEELSARAIPVLLCNLALRNVDATVKQRDVITDKTENTYILTKGERYSDIKQGEECAKHKTALIISNPPYSLGWEQKRDPRFLGYDLPPSSKADYVFVLDAVSRLYDGGRAYLILPHGILFRGQSEGKIRQELIDNNLIDAVIGVPDNMFLNTGIPVCIICLHKNRNTKNVLFIDAQRLCEKIGKQNVMTEEHIAKIVDAYKNRKPIEKLCAIASYDKIRANDFNLNIPRYVDSSPEKEKVDFSAIVTELIQTEREIKNNNIGLAKMVRELRPLGGAVDNFIGYLEGKQ